MCVRTMSSGLLLNAQPPPMYLSTLSLGSSRAGTLVCSCMLILSTCAHATYACTTLVYLPTTFVYECLHTTLVRRTAREAHVGPCVVRSSMPCEIWKLPAAALQHVDDAWSKVKRCVLSRGDVLECLCVLSTPTYHCRSL